MPASPTVDAIRSEIVSSIKTVLCPSNPTLVASVVHDYRRFWRDAAKFKSLFRRTDAGWTDFLNGWMVTRVSTNEVEADEWFRFYRLHRFRMFGYFGIQDSGKTEKDFQDQVEGICDALRLNYDVFSNTEKASPVIPIEGIDRYEIGECNVWHARLTLVAEAVENKW